MKIIARNQERLDKKRHKDELELKLTRDKWELRDLENFTRGYDEGRLSNQTTP